jgi:hypothetical protein
VPEDVTNLIVFSSIESVIGYHTFIHYISFNALMVTLTMKEVSTSSDEPLIEEVSLLILLLASCCIVVILITTTLLKELILPMTVAEADLVDISAISYAALWILAGAQGRNTLVPAGNCFRLDI